MQFNTVTSTGHSNIPSGAMMMQNGCTLQQFVPHTYTSGQEQFSNGQPRFVQMNNSFPPFSGGVVGNQSQAGFAQHAPTNANPQVVWTQTQNGNLVPMYIVSGSQSNGLQQTTPLNGTGGTQTPYQIVIPASQLQGVTTTTGVPSSVYSMPGQAGPFVSTANGPMNFACDPTFSSTRGLSNVSSLPLATQISMLASRIEAYLLENVQEGSMRSLSVSLTLKQQEPELSKCVMPHFEHSWHRFVQHCPNLSVFYYRQTDIERLGLHGYAEEHEARLRVSRFPKQVCEQRDYAIVKHQQHHAELATVYALLQIRDAPSGVIELSHLRTFLSVQSPVFFKEMTRSAFKRLLTRVPKTPVWISGNYIKLRRNFALVPWASSLHFTGTESDPMVFVQQMVTRLAPPSNTSMHSDDVETDTDTGCDGSSRNTSMFTESRTVNGSVCIDGSNSLSDMPKGMTWSPLQVVDVPTVAPSFVERSSTEPPVSLANDTHVHIMGNEVPAAVPCPSLLSKEPPGVEQGEPSSILNTRSTNSSLATPTPYQ